MLENHESILFFSFWNPFYYRCVARNTVGESSTTLHLIVKTQLNVIVEPDLLVADFGSNAEFTCKAYRRDEDEEESQGEKKDLALRHMTNLNSEINVKFAIRGKIGKKSKRGFPR